MQHAYQILDNSTQGEALAVVFAHHAAMEMAAEKVRELFPKASPAEMKELIKGAAEDYIRQAALVFDMSDDVGEQVFADTLRTGLTL